MRSTGIGIGIALLIIGVVCWPARKPLHRIYHRDRALCVSSLAQILGHTTFINSPGAHALLSDFAGLERYRLANRSLPPGTQGRVVFYGDSITDFWSTNYPATFFPGKPYLGRGITGQSTDALLWRFQQDVIDLHPDAVVLLAGTNDVVLTDRHFTFEQTTANIQAIVNVAQQHHVRVILCSLPPVSHYPEPQQAIFSKEIRAVNNWIQTYAARENLTYVDYYSAMADDSGALKSTLTKDGLHPNAAGYNVMRPLAQRAIDGHP